MANRTVRPAAVSCRIEAQNRRRVSTSIAAVGSSSTSSSGSAHQREREPDPLGLAAGQLGGAPVGQLGQVGALQHLVDRHRRRVERGGQHEQLAHGDLGDQPAALQHRADQAGPDRLARRTAEDRDLAGVRAGQAEQHVDGGGLAGAVRAEQGHGLPGDDVEVDPGHGPHRAVRLGEAAEAAVRRRAWSQACVHCVTAAPTPQFRPSGLRRDTCQIRAHGRQRVLRRHPAGHRRGRQQGTGHPRPPGRAATGVRNVVR